LVKKRREKIDLSVKLLSQLCCILGDEDVEFTKKVDAILRFLELVRGKEGQKGQHINYYAEQLGCSPRTIRRYIDDISLSGFPIFLEDGIVKTEQKMTEVNGYLNPNETFLLLLAVDTLKKSSSNPEVFDRLVDSITRYAKSNTLEEATLISDRVKIYPGLSEEVTTHPKVLDSLLKAIYVNNAVEFFYQKPIDAEPEKRMVDPYYLFFKKTDWYLIGRCHQRDDLRIFRVGRMTEVKQVLEPFQMPDDLSIESYLADVWELEKGGEEYEIEIIFNPSVAPIVMETKYHPLEKKKRLPDGSVNYKVKCAGKNEMLRWVLSFGANAQVISPQEFSEDLLVIGKYYVEAYS